jgi:hypothetical protein
MAFPLQEAMERQKKEEEERQRLAELEAQRQALLAEYYEAEAGWLQAEHAELEPLTQQYAHQRARVSECAPAGWLRLAHCMHAHRDARCHARHERVAHAPFWLQPAITILLKPLARTGHAAAANALHSSISTQVVKSPAQEQRHRGVYTSALHVCL